MNLTIFSTPRPFVGNVGSNQSNAIASWRHIASGVILFDCCEQDAQGVQVCNDIRKSLAGTPYIGDIFEQAQKLAAGDVMMYCNADMIFLPSLTSAIESVLPDLSKFVGVGRRTDLDITGPIEFSESWATELEDRARREGQLHDACGMDYIIFTHPLSVNWLPLLVGRPAWDVWLLRQIIEARIPLVDMTHDVMAIHANHGERQYEAGENANAEAIQEAEYNRSLTKHIQHAYITHANYKLVGGKVEREYGRVEERIVEHAQPLGRDSIHFTRDSRRRAGIRRGR